MLRPHRFVQIGLMVLPILWVTGGVPAGKGATGVPALQAAAQPQSASHMKQHFDQVEVVQNAVVRGDLDGVREPATWLAEHAADTSLPVKSTTQIAAMQAAAKRAAEAPDIKTAASATATMASTCGTCHRSNNVTPKMPDLPPIQGSGVSGHMLAHQRAVDYMYQGLAAPSDRLWVQGADMLKAAPLEKGSLPADAKLTEEIKAFEGKVHEIAERARRASEPKTRVLVYSEIISGCAECHGLHGKAWGPGLPK
jgi:cytochrome c553